MDRTPKGLPNMGSARELSSQIAKSMILARAERLQGVGLGEGARSPAGPARRPVELVELFGDLGSNGKPERLTPLGYRTARAAMPRVLADLPELDARRRVAVDYAHAAERVGAMPGAWASGGGATGMISDGGAVSRCQVAHDLALMRSVLVGVALAPVRQGRGRRAIMVRDAVDAVCLQGAEVPAVLRVHGWTGASVVRRLADEILRALDAMALQKGY